MRRYAWLEHDRGMWHFLTNLLADPAESTRRWSDKHLALIELMDEGWTIVRPYPKKHPMMPCAETISGYGLSRMVH